MFKIYKFKTDWEEYLQHTYIINQKYTQYTLRKETMTQTNNKEHEQAVSEKET